MNNERFRLWPASLGGQLIALLLIALIVAQCLTLWLFAGERRLALVEMARTTFLSRTASLVRLLETTPQAQHADILQAVSSPLLWFRVDDRPIVAESGERAGERRFVQLLKDELGADRDVRVDVVPGPRFLRDRDRVRDHDRAERRERYGKRRRNGAFSLTMSVALADGRWLNAATRFRLPTHSFYPLLVSIGLMALAIVGVVAFTIQRLTRPLRGLSAAAERLGRGEDVESLAETGPTEVRGTVRAFNVMQDRLTRFVRDRTRMLAAISHDLRTPITSLRIRAEFIEDEENREKMIETLDEMQRMVEAALAFARDEAAKETAARIDLGEFIDTIAEDYRDMGCEVSFAPPQARVVARFRPLSLKRALRNLIDNAVRYAETAELSVEAARDTVQIRVCDRGPGIPETRLGDVFDPFVRLEESRSEDTGGIGLGLSIARSIVQAHGGSLTLENRAEGGLEACVTLPA
ncbi:ATP-binding protein [Stappia sp. ES.058]|uniref:ATP-binding protein n=1 Tax=Stappia sp. ES.058 TaxID=1881061 RepID=UPI00087D7819|nr:ATP-binding protein [Stappia sp. ES.058]SDT97829.1 Signal transduction histidine kinase [Stappia sp. ES.058]